MSNKKEPVCSFCGKQESEVYKLILGPKANICDECVEACEDLIEEEGEPVDDTFGDVNILSPKEIKSKLDDYVIGQANLQYPHNARMQYKPL